MSAAIRVELAKLRSQLVVEIALAVCLLAPIAFALVMRVQNAVPADTLFGRWATTTGFATSLTVLGFAGSLGLPFLAGVLAGDVFSSEDRYGTWKTILTRSRTRDEIFAGKTVAAFASATVAVLVLGISSLVSGVVLVGSSPLVGLSGQLVSHAAWLVLASWAYTVLPVLVYVSLALLLSIVSRSGIVGVLGPTVVGLVMQLLALLGPGEIVRAFLLGTPFDAWHSLFTQPVDAGPLVQGVVTSVLYIALFLGVAWLVLRRRDFSASDTGRRRVPVRTAVAVAAAIALLIVAGGWGPTPLTASHLQKALTPTFENLVFLQYRLRTHQDPRNERLHDVVTCKRSSGESTGPGEDWTCVVRVLNPLAGGAAMTLDVSLRANGCYTAQAPPSIIGPLRIRDLRGRPFLNPLYAFDGCFGTA